ncbi:hypothetical protein CVT25_013342 [Psilocybe cyanescens]|uniref:Terpene synthase n=1 Tax=Psilocybe cyanescens TaxID=93625 RepID=A0A409WT28_PSICY|nr:hypothetical protein CVT25_013342 [Psilocybe cyanescens]
MATQSYTLHSSHSETSGPSSSLAADVAKDESFNSIKRIYAAFIENLEYSPEGPISDNNETYQALLTEFAAYNTGGKWFQALCQESSTLAEVRVSLNCDLQMYLIYVDDLGQKFPLFLEGFQERVLTGKNPEGPFLNDYRAHLADMYHLWDTLPANFITLSGMDFINGCVLEQTPAIRDMRLSQAAHWWPYYLRNKTGSATAYAYMLFPKEIHIDMSIYIQVIEDIIFYINLTNDILSPSSRLNSHYDEYHRFYKEDLAGERNNYIYNRAHVTQKSALDALQDTINEIMDAHARITEVLKDTAAYVPWRIFVNGYIAFHHTLKRYHLEDLGFKIVSEIL